MINETACTENPLKSDRAKYILYDYHNNRVVKDIVEDELNKLDYDSDKQLVYEKPESEAEYAAFLDWLAAWHTACGGLTWTV